MTHRTGFTRTGVAAALAATLALPAAYAEVAGESAIRVGHQLIGATLRSEEGEEIGKIADVVIDERGRIQHLVVENGDRTFQVPWQGTQLRLGAGQVVVDRGRDQLTGGGDAQKRVDAGRDPGERAAEQQAGGARTDVVPARGTQPREQTAVSFTALDENNDGLLSSTEAQRAVDLRERFSELDLNQDGNLDRAEYSAFEIEPSGPTTAIAEGTDDQAGAASQGAPEAASAPADGEAPAAREEGASGAETDMAQRQPMWGDKRLDVPEPGEDRPNPSLQSDLTRAESEQGPPATGAGGQQDRPGGIPERYQSDGAEGGQAQAESGNGQQAADPQQDQGQQARDDRQPNQQQAQRAEGSQAPAGGEQAAEQEQQGEPNFANLDADGDGVLTREEAQRSEQLTQRFRDYDRDNDGRLTRAEFVVYAALAPEEGERTPEFSRLDRNDDGVLSQAETEGSRGLYERFTELDTDSDGALNPTEFAAFEEQQGQARDGGGEREEGRAGRQQRGGSGGGAQSESRGAPQR